MEPLFEAHYEETRDTLIQTCELYRLDANRLLYPVAWVCACIMVSFLLINKESMQQLALSDYLIYAGVWLGILVAMEIFRRTMGKKLAMTAAIGDGDRAFAERTKDRKNPLQVTIQFYDNAFSNKTQSQQVDYAYGRVTHILESDRALGIVVRSAYGPRGIYSFPKESVTADTYEELKRFLIASCPKVKSIRSV